MRGASASASARTLPVSSCITSASRGSLSIIQSRRRSSHLRRPANPIDSHSGWAARTLPTTSATRSGGSIGTDRITDPSAGRWTSKVASSAEAPFSDSDLALWVADALSITPPLYSRGADYFFKNPIARPSSEGQDRGSGCDEDGDRSNARLHPRHRTARSGLLDDLVDVAVAERGDV